MAATHDQHLATAERDRRRVPTFARHVRQAREAIVSRIKTVCGLNAFVEFDEVQQAAFVDASVTTNDDQLAIRIEGLSRAEHFNV